MGGPEIVVIIIIALLVLGPDQLPKAMRTMGNAMAQVNKVKGGFQAEMDKAMAAVETATKGDPEPKAKARTEPAAKAEPAAERPAATPAPASDADRAAERASS